MAIGVPYGLFMKMKPIELRAFGKAHKLRQKIKDEEMWLHNRYTLEALMIALSHFGAGLAGKNSKAEYMKHPFLFDEISENKYKESNEEIAVFEMKQRINSLKNMGLKESPM